MKLIITIAFALVFSSLEARTVNTNYPISNEISNNRRNFRPINNYGQEGKQNAPIATTPTTVMAPVTTGIQGLMASPIFQAMLSNITVQTVLSDPIVQGVLSNPTVQSVLSNPIVQAILTNPALQGLAMQTFLSAYPSAMNTAVAAPTPLTAVSTVGTVTVETVPTEAVTTTARPTTTTVMRAIIAGLDEIINLLQTQNTRRNRIRQRNRNPTSRL